MEKPENREGLPYPPKTGSIIIMLDWKMDIYKCPSNERGFHFTKKVVLSYHDRVVFFGGWHHCDHKENQDGQATEIVNCITWKVDPAMSHQKSSRVLSRFSKKNGSNRK